MPGVNLSTLDLIVMAIYLVAVVAWGMIFTSRQPRDQQVGLWLGPSC